MRIITPVGEAAFVSVFRPAKAMEGSTNQDPKFQMTILWSKKDPNLKKLRDAIKKVATEKWGAKAPIMLDKGQLKSPLRDGDERGDDADGENWRAGKVFLTARTTTRPGIVNEDLEDIIDHNEVYAGCKARMAVWLYAFDKAGNKGVAALLNHVQKMGDGERKDGYKTAAQTFSEGDDGVEDDDNSML